MNQPRQTPQHSKLWLAVALSMTAIFSSYAVSVLNHESDSQVNVYSSTPRPVVVSYLA